MSTLEFNNQVIGYSKQLKYFALNLTANDDDAQDLLQDTLIKAIMYKDKFADATNLKAWLYTIMKNVFINNYRRTVKTRSIIDTNTSLSHINAKQKGSPRMAESTMTELEVNAAIDSLPSDFGMPFRMYFEGYKYKEIAEHMDVPIGTIKSRIFLARKILMDELKTLRA